MIINAVTDALSILGAVVSAYLALGIGLAFLEGQIDAATGRVVASDIVKRITLLVVCVALVVFARSISNEVEVMVGGNPNDSIESSINSSAEVRNAILDIAQYFLDIVIGAAALVLAISVAAGFVGAQLATMAGEAVQLSSIVARLFIIVALAVGAFLTITISHVIIGALR